MPFGGGGSLTLGYNNQKRIPNAGSQAQSYASRAGSNAYIGNHLRPNASQSGSVTGYPAGPGSTATVRTRLDIGPIDTAPRQYQRGMIVKIPHIVPTLNPSETNPDYKVYTRKIGNVCPKIRWAVVVAIYEQKLIVLPIYTCSGNGLSKKPVSYRLTAMSIINPSETRDEFTKQLTPDPLYVAGSWQTKPGAHVNLNEPYAISYGWPIRIIDQLLPSSEALVHDRYLTVSNMGYEDPLQQMAWFNNEISAQKRSQAVLRPKQVTGGTRVLATACTSRTNHTATTSRTPVSVIRV